MAFTADRSLAQITLMIGVYRHVGVETRAIRRGCHRNTVETHTHATEHLKIVLTSMVFFDRTDWRFEQLE
jgi:hypothetical protein